MANPEHLAILGQGVEKWNEWRAANPEVAPNLINAKLRGRVGQSPISVNLRFQLRNMKLFLPR